MIVANISLFDNVKLRLESPNWKQVIWWNIDAARMPLVADAWLEYTEEPTPEHPIYETYKYLDGTAPVKEFEAGSHLARMTCRRNLLREPDCDPQYMTAGIVADHEWSFEVSPGSEPRVRESIAKRELRMYDFSRHDMFFKSSSNDENYVQFCRLIDYINVIQCAAKAEAVVITPFAYRFQDTPPNKWDEEDIVLYESDESRLK